MNNKERRIKYATDPKFRAQLLAASHKYQKSEKAKEDNKIRCRLYNQKYYGKNIQYTLRTIVRSRISLAFKAQKAERLYSFDKLLGCSLKDYQKYLTKNFKPKMSWKQKEGHKWQIDHKRPVSSFDLNIGKNQLAAFNYKNTQPLFVGEHIKKTSRYVMDLENRCIILKNKNKQYKKAIREVLK